MTRSFNASRAMVACAVIFLAAGACMAAVPDASETAGLIDQQIEARLAKENVSPAKLANDAEFLRRVYLDLRGVVPTYDQASRFLSDSRTDKRARLVEELLASPRYGQYLADAWQHDLISPLADDRQKRSEIFQKFLADEFNNKTWDQIASRLLTASGRMEQNPAVIYLIEGRLPRSVPDLTDLTSRYFLGLRLSCAQCHDHPFANWKQQDFWGMAAFFAQIQTPKRAKQVYEKGVIDDRNITLATLRDAAKPDGFMLCSPKFLGGPELSEGRTTGRAALASWMTAPDNPYFARAAVNRAWWRLFGRGIVNPVDDMDEANPPTHPQLLDLLAQRFIESGFDLKYLTRAIILSRAYQRTSRPDGASDAQMAHFGRMSIKVLSAGQLYDSLETIFGPPAKVSGIDARAGARAEFIQFFGDTADIDPIAYRRGIPHLLRQMNSGQFGERGMDALVSRVMTSGSSPDAIASELFLTILSRQPTPEELDRIKAYVKHCDSPQSGWREVAWVLMMASEFSLNH